MYFSNRSNMLQLDKNQLDVQLKCMKVKDWIQRSFNPIISNEIKRKWMYRTILSKHCHYQSDTSSAIGELLNVSHFEMRIFACCYFFFHGRLCTFQFHGVLIVQQLSTRINCSRVFIKWKIISRNIIILFIEFK